MSIFRAAADVGLRRARFVASGRFTPDTHRSYSEASISGLAPQSGPPSLLDKLTSSVTGTKLDPATLMGLPPSVPADWAAQQDGDIKYAFYTEGINAGAVKASVVVGGGMLLLGGLLGFMLGRRGR